MFKTSETRESLLRKSGIYKITLCGTNRNYIGQSANLWKRMRAHINEANSNSGRRKCKIQSAIRKYGSEAFDYSVLVFCDIGNLDELEEGFILRFNGVSEGFNRAEEVIAPGRGLIPSQEHRDKIRAANTGKKRSPETIEKMRRSALMKPPRTEESKAKQSATLKARGYKCSEARKASLNKPVHQLDAMGNVVATYKSVKEASKAAGLQNTCAVSNAIRKAYRCGGFLWKYASHQPN